MDPLARPVPIVSAPMAGSSTPAMAAAVSRAGGLGFLAGGYLTPRALAAEVSELRAEPGPVAVNLFTPQTDRSAELSPAIDRHRAGLVPTAERFGTQPGPATYDDDWFVEKAAWLVAHPVDLVTFTFGPVPGEVVSDLQAAGTRVGFTVTSRHEAEQAVALGADILVVQGCDAGGHRGTWHISDEPNEIAALELTTRLSPIGLPVIAAGGVAGPEHVAALLAAGATSVAVGTLFVTCDESRSPAAHKEALASGQFDEARATRAFSGRWARALVNDFVRAHEGTAPAAYPNLHHLSRPIRAAAAAAGDPQGMALWAGSGHHATKHGSAADVVRLLAP